MNHNLKLSVAIATVFLANNSVAGGLSLPQIGTAESTGTAGVSNVTNNRDASAVITNPAALSGIEDSSLILGLAYQYQSLGDAEITGKELTANGSYEDNRVHFITGSLSF